MLLFYSRNNKVFVNKLLTFECGLLNSLVGTTPPQHTSIQPNFPLKNSSKQGNSERETERVPTPSPLRNSSPTGGYWSWEVLKCIFSKKYFVGTYYYFHTKNSEKFYKKYFLGTVGKCLYLVP